MVYEVDIVAGKSKPETMKVLSDGVKSVYGG